MIFCVLQDFLSFAGFFLAKTDMKNLEHYTLIRISESVNLQKVFFSIFCKPKSEESSP